MDLRFSSSPCLIPLAGLLITGCSQGHRTLDHRRNETPGRPIRETVSRVNRQALRESGDIAPFVKDVSSGNATKWRLVSHASRGVKRAWRNKERIEAIGYELRHGQAWWGCTLLDAMRKGVEEHHVAVTAEREGAAVVTVNVVMGKAHLLTSAELGDIIDADCHTH